MRFVVAPDSFKGSLMAWDVAQAISTGIRLALPDAAILPIPIGDGGEGTARALAHAVPGAQMVPATVSDPLGRPVRAEFAMLDAATAVVEMAAASGLGLLQPAERDPMRTDTFGTGQLVVAALDRLAVTNQPAAGGCPSLYLAVGGSATVDGGMGMLAALGARFLDREGHPLTSLGGGSLASVGAVDLSGLDPRIRSVKLVLASDVSNPLLGPAGAAAVFGPQKGATPGQVKELDQGLAHLRQVVFAASGAEMDGFPGGGAAGGVGAAAVALLGATFRPGIDIALECTRFAERAAGADLVFTGEGRYDRQTLSGKAAFGVAQAAAALRIPVCVLAGGIDATAEWQLPGSAVVLPIADGPLTLAESQERAASLIAAAARRATALFMAGRQGKQDGAWMPA